MTTTSPAVAATGRTDPESCSASAAGSVVHHRHSFPGRGHRRPARRTGRAGRGGGGGGRRRARGGGGRRGRRGLLGGGGRRRGLATAARARPPSGGRDRASASVSAPDRRPWGGRRAHGAGPGGPGGGPSCRRCRCRRRSTGPRCPAAAGSSSRRAGCTPRCSRRDRRASTTSRQRRGRGGGRVLLLRRRILLAALVPAVADPADERGTVVPGAGGPPAALVEQPAGRSASSRRSGRRGAPAGASSRPAPRRTRWCSGRSAAGPPTPAPPGPAAPHRSARGRPAPVRGRGQGACSPLTTRRRTPVAGGHDRQPARQDQHRCRGGEGEGLHAGRGEAAPVPPPPPGPSAFTMPPPFSPGVTITGAEEDGHRVGGGALQTAGQDAEGDAGGPADRLRRGTDVGSRWPFFATLNPPSLFCCEVRNFSSAFVICASYFSASRDSPCTARPAELTEFPEAPGKPPSASCRPAIQASPRLVHGGRVRVARDEVQGHRGHGGRVDVPVAGGGDQAGPGARVVPEARQIRDRSLGGLLLAGAYLREDPQGLGEDGRGVGVGALGGGSSLSGAVPRLRTRRR
ncbi:hypothetical protein SCALM49S_08403 [Streptomyces californicus]